MRDYKTQAERYRTGAPPDLWNKPSTYWKGGGKPKIMQADFETYGEVDLQEPVITEVSRITSKKYTQEEQT